jgi:hypothetical protein
MASNVAASFLFKKSGNLDPTDEDELLAQSQELDEYFIDPG